MQKLSTIVYQNSQAWMIARAHLDQAVRLDVAQLQAREKYNIATKKFEEFTKRFDVIHTRNTNTEIAEQKINEGFASIGFEPENPMNAARIGWNAAMQYIMEHVTNEK